MQEGCLFFGFDFPIGVPSAYGEQTGYPDFRSLMDVLGSGDWQMWFNPAQLAREISIKRPFYPARPGGTSRAHLLEGLNLTAEQLVRLCEYPRAGRSSPSILFWTMGAAQVGKAAMAGWRELIRPFRDDIGLWPFDGPLDELFGSRKIVVGESYPADAYDMVGLPRKPVWSKRRQEDRRRFAPILRNWLALRPDQIATDELLATIDDGFGSDTNGEDRFDAFMGLLAMLEIVSGRRGEGGLNEPAIRRWEGWILGREEKPVSDSLTAPSS